MMKKILFGFFLAFFSGTGGRSLAQAPEPYLKAATLYIATDGWVDIYLNGIPIVDSQRTTPGETGPQKIECVPGHLCYFRRENILAIENTNAVRNPPPVNDHIGIAYVLRMVLSNGAEITMSSNDVEDHTSFYIANRMSGDPVGWHYADFNDGYWSRPQNTGFTIPSIAFLNDPESGRGIQFLSASETGNRVRYPGERHLYRRKFSLDIGPNPICGSPGERPGPEPEAENHDGPPEYPEPHASAARTFPRMFPPTPVFTALPTPTVFWIPIAVPTRLPAVRPAYARPAENLPAPEPPWTPRFWTTPTATFTRMILFERTPTPLPVRVPARWAAPPVYGQPPAWRRPTATPDFSFVPRATVEPMVRTAPPVEVKRAVRTGSTPTMTPEPAAGQAQTVDFGPDEANLYVTFADGPGRYRLEAADQRGNHLKTLLDRREITGDAWVVWNGKDDQGRDMPPGRYQVIFSKNGKLLNKIIVMKAAVQ